MYTDLRKFREWKENYSQIISTVVGIIVRAVGKLDPIPVHDGCVSYNINSDMLTEEVAMYMYRSTPQQRLEISD
jgi:hypothetical protein